MPPLPHSNQSYSPAFNQQSAGLWNRRLILNLLNCSGPLSRRQIAQRTGILGSTVAYIVRDLLETGLLTVEGKGPASGVGRRNILLGVNRKYGWAMGVSLLHNNTARVELLNSGLERLESTTFPVDPDPENLPEQLADRLHGWLDLCGRPEGKFLGVGVGLPGIVDVKENKVLRSIHFGYRDFALGERLEALFRAPVGIEHNAHLGAHAERRYGRAASLKDFVYLLMNRSEYEAGRPFYSYGASLYLGGEVYRGAHCAAGELERRNIPKLDLKREEAEALGENLADKDAPLTPLMSELAKALGHYLAPVVDLLDPEAIVLGGDCPLVNRPFLALVEGWINRLTLSLQGRRIRILPSHLGDSGVACGAALRMVETGLYERELAELGKTGVRNGNGHGNGETRKRPETEAQAEPAGSAVQD